MGPEPMPFPAIAIVGMDCALPGAAGLEEFSRLLFSGESGVGELTAEQLDRELYFCAKRGTPGKTYTTVGGMVPQREISAASLGLSEEEFQQFDPVHLRFCDVAVRAWRRAGLEPHSVAWTRTGVYVGHSGATQRGGPLGLATLIDEGLDFLNDLEEFQRLPTAVRRQILQRVSSTIRSSRPSRQSGPVLHYQATTVAHLPARALGLNGPRIVCDAACASALFAMQQAIQALQLGRINAALVGGATTNGVDNLILFSQSQACSESGSSPFDQQASGLVSSEGYAAVVIMREETARQQNLPVLGIIEGLGISSDGRGKSLWAPRAEGQQLAMQRAYSSRTSLDIDYLEAHATSTQLGDATELHSVSTIRQETPAFRAEPLLIGSLKSNLGHTLETAGLAGLIKILLSMQRGQIPATLNFERPNANFDWSARTVEVVARTRSWPNGKNRVKRAAVSAFGIGGLNAHLTVRESDADPASHPRIAPASSQVTNDREPIAIVGRGLVLPGAHRLSQFRELLVSGESKIGPPPEHRWRPGIGIDPGRIPHAQGGYVRDYHFDAQAYRIPPKQVRQSNPLQLMLLDAVSQAIQEFDGGRWSIDHQRTGVIIGSIFGGDFSGQLQFGLRLPEICRELAGELRRHALSVGQVQSILDAYREHFLQVRPALLDETGSFTASTLASRIAKTFDLMGGAAAIDVDEASGLAAIRAALDQLRTGHWDFAVCGAASRSMDLNAFQQLHRTGKLLPCGRFAAIPADGSQILPGEGTVVLLLERLSQARAAGHAVLGVIHDVEVVPSPREQSPRLNETEAAIVRQIGYVSGVHPLIEIVRRTIQGERSRALRTAASTDDALIRSTQDGLCYQLSFQTAKVQAVSPEVPIPVSSGHRAEPVKQNFQIHAGRERFARLMTPRFHADIPSSLQPPAFGLRLIRLQGRTQEELERLIAETIAQPEPALHQPLDGYSPGQPWRLALLAESPIQLAASLTSLAKIRQRGRQEGVFETERALVWRCRPGQARVAWVYPGQGGHYSGLPQAVRSSRFAQEALAAFDTELAQAGLPQLSPHLETPDPQWASGLWESQAWVLGLSLAFTAELKARGLRPDVVLGHSFGEYSALVAAGCLTLPQVIRMVKSRADAVAMTVREAGQLISVRGAPAEVEAVIRRAGLSAQITHWNAPSQTVIATEKRHVAAVRDHLTAANLASVPVSVPVAFHTPRLAQAATLLTTLTAGERFLPPVCSLLSATSVRSLSEPDDLREALVSQLTQPVLYAPAVERLLSEDVAVLIEAGPNQILSKLNREIAGDRALCLSFDLPGRDHAERLLLIQAAMEIVGSTSNIGSGSFSNSYGSRFADGSGVWSNQRQAANVSSARTAPHDVEVVDLHRTAGRKKLAQTAPIAPSFRSESPVAPSSVPQSLDTLHLLNGESGTKSERAASEQEIRNLLLSVVMDLTGYAPEVIDFGADLEADLGIDSIKKAQIIGELAETFGLTANSGGLSPASLISLNDIVRMVLQLRGTPVTSAASSGLALNSAMKKQDVSPFLPTASSLSHQSSPEVDIASIERFLIDLVVDQTGYSPDVVDLDADMEGELGIDSIKQAQLLGEVQQQFELPNVQSPTGALASFSTLRSILNYLTEVLPRQGSTAFRLTTPDTSSVSPERRDEDSFRTSHKTCPDLLAEREFSESEEVLFAALKKPFDRAGEQSIPNGLAVESQGPRLCLPITNDVPAEWKDLFAASSHLEEEKGWHAGWLRGRASAQEIRQTLMLLIDRDECRSVSGVLSPLVIEELNGLATGAGVSLASVMQAHRLFHPCEGNTPALPPASSRIVEKDPSETNEHSINGIQPVCSEPFRTMRSILYLTPAPRRAGLPEGPTFSGPAIILGQNEIATALEARLRCEGIGCYRVPAVHSLEELDRWLSEIWEAELTPHLFLTTSHDDESLKQIDVKAWASRRFAALEVPYRLCQRWMQRLIDADRLHEGSLVSVVNLGGDFGLSGRAGMSPEGGQTGLVKAMMVEAWMRGHRTTPMKVIDITPSTTPDQTVTGVWRELARPSFDTEIALDGEDRFTLRATVSPLDAKHPASPSPGCRIRRGGTWVVTGGARGITALTVRELAKRHGLKLHLIGTAPPPALPEAWTIAGPTDRQSLRRTIISAASRQGQNGMEAWKNVEKALEIEETLRQIRADGIAATYHSCDVANLAQLNSTLDRIRQQDGPISGVIHGAGIGQDARFDRKRPDKVDQCLRAKIDGCIHLMEATREDPLESFVAFGSISGRFGANGHTDYSLANDTLAKLVDCYRTERPEVAGFTFHWHAWGDVGMATKPETRLALEMVQLDFMPAREGIEHFLKELEYGGRHSEILITDRSYLRKFFPEKCSLPVFPLLAPQENDSVSGGDIFSLELSPQQERFLSQHCIQEVPTLPFVIAIEMMAEAARLVTGKEVAVEARDVQAFQALKWQTTAPRQIQVQTRQDSSGVTCTVTSDVCRRDGRLVTAGKVYFEGTFQTASNISPLPSPLSNSLEMQSLEWKRVHYPLPGAPIYHGPDLQSLQSITCCGDRAFGRLFVPSIVQLGGGHRPTSGWSLHAAAMDGCLYACALLVGERSGRASLPVRFERIRFGRLPDAGEPCLVSIQLQQETSRGAVLAFQLTGQNGDLLLDVEGYHLHWLG